MLWIPEQGWALGYMPLVLPRGKQKQVYISEFEARLVPGMLQTSQGYLDRPCLKKKKRKNWIEFQSKNEQSPEESRFLYDMFMLNEYKTPHSKCSPHPTSEKQEIKHLYGMNLEVSGAYFTFVRQ